MRIRQLPRDVVTKIAAGEVIERPASVVKELLENAIDAGSSRIDVEVEAGGADRICVADDGCGILPDDLPLAFASHATSKLADADDLFRVTTLGFRGEALASIGGVAHVTLQSRAAGRSAGAELVSHGGELSGVRSWNGSQGTRIDVQHLFYNTPVRRKFLRTAGTEMGHICEAFTRLALACPGLHFALRHNGKSVYEVPANVGPAERIGLFFGAQVRDALYSIEVAEGPIRLTGFVADPACERGNAKLQYLFVNGRWIRDRTLGHALQEAYRGLLMTGRYAVAFLYLDLAPDQVDVNVHPTKAEVRFRQGSAVYQLVFRAVRERLRRENLVPRLQVPAGQGVDFASDVVSSATRWGEGPLLNVRPTPPSAGINPVARQTLPARAAWPEPAPRPPSDAHEQSPPPPSNVTTSSAWPAKAIQLYDAYLVLETPEGMLVIDQHALHERILFEQLKRRIRSGHLETQPLLIPEPVELPADQAARALEHRAELAALGLEVEDFGRGTLLLRSYPAILGNRPPAEALKAVVDHLAANDRAPDREQLFNNLLSLMACHAAVRAGERLTAEEIAALVAQRELAGDTHHCPHGRPTSLLLSRQELDRQFRRV